VIGAIESSVESGKYKDAHTAFEKYAENLLDHIAVEDDEVFQIPETIFDESEMERIYFRFMDCDADLGASEKKKMEAMIS
jgi:hemerythrin-like domain-containing protein